MGGLLFTIDRLSAWVGKAFAWCILALTLGISYEVFVRYVLTAPTKWAFDFSYIMYGALFMMAGAYTLSRDGHVRGNFVYRMWAPRVQASVDLTLHLLFFFPGITALIIAGTDFAAYSWRFLEVSSSSPADIPVFPLKTLIPIAGVILFLQGIAEVIRCVMCIRDGQWPTRLHDVEETETVLMHAKEHEGSTADRASLSPDEGRQ
ncbi:MAG: TRAP transporter small permease subunit [Arenicellales bacterium]|nr:TRAP transporter small permease subunit [Arenicellales bacterium]